MMVLYGELISSLVHSLQWKLALSMVMGCADQFNKLPMGLCRIISSVFSSCVKWHLLETQVCVDLTEKAMRSEPQSLMLKWKRHTEPEHLQYFRAAKSSFHRR